MEFPTEDLLSFVLDKISHLNNWEEIAKDIVQTLKDEQMKELRALCISGRAKQVDLKSMRYLSYLVFLIDNRQYMDLIGQRRQD